MECPHCQKGGLSKVEGNPPFTTNHLQCDACESTFIDETDASIYKRASVHMALEGQRLSPKKPRKAKLC